MGWPGLASRLMTMIDDQPVPYSYDTVLYEQERYDRTSTLGNLQQQLATARRFSSTRTRTVLVEPGGWNLSRWNLLVEGMLSRWNEWE